MNTTSGKHSVRLIAIVAAVTLQLLAAPLHAAISVVDSFGEFVNDVDEPTYGLENVPYTNSSFSAGAADKLIVTVVAGDDGVNVPNPSITYAGAGLTLVTGTDWGATERQKGIYYLDDPASSGDLVFDFTASANVNGFAYGVVSIAGSADGTAEVAAKMQWNGSDYDPVTITPATDGSFVVASFAAQQGVSVLTNALTQIIPDGPGDGYGTWTDGDIGTGTAGYELNVSAAAQTYEDAGILYYKRDSAAAFAPAPPAQAEITWTVYDITDSATDVSTIGTLIEARSGDLANSYVVNTVSFAAGKVFPGNREVLAVIPASLDAAYSNLLHEASSQGDKTLMTVTFEGLESGKTYEIQIWASHTGYAAYGLVLSNGTGDANPATPGHATLLYQVSAGEPGQYALGRFTATGTSQTFSVQRWGNLSTTPTIENQPYTNAAQIREVPPESSTGTLFYFE